MQPKHCRCLEKPWRIKTIGEVQFSVFGTDITQVEALFFGCILYGRAKECGDRG